MTGVQTCALPIWTIPRGRNPNFGSVPKTLQSEGTVMHQLHFDKHRSKGMKSRRVMVTIASVLVTGASLAGCSGPSGGSDEPVGEPKSGGTLSGLPQMVSTRFREKAC